jgi:levansucrase
VIYPPAEDVDPEYHVWDTWLLRDRDGTIADVDGYRAIVALAAPADVLPGKRHDVAELRYYYSADGRNWSVGGPIFPDSEPLGSRQWAGCALRDGRDLYVYYTAAGRRDEAELSYTQRIAVASGGEIRTDGGDESRAEDDGDGDGVVVEGTYDHEVLLEPDGDRYETEAQSRGMIYTFRDPWFFEDPSTEETCLLFEANTPVPEGSDAPGGDPAPQEFNGSVGLAVSPTGDPTEFELRDPLLDAVRVNQELERPHLVLDDGRYYLFVSSHEHTFAPGLEGFDALYGFVADSLRGEYEPLNGSGLVLTNPDNAPFQSYSWLAYPHREETLVTSFFNYYDLRGRSLDDVADLPESEQLRRFGGTLAPTVRLALEGSETRLLGVLDHAHLPLPAEELPALRERGDRGGGGEYGYRSG